MRELFSGDEINDCFSGAFKLYDLDSDGYITKEEMCNILDSICLMLGDSIEENRNFDPKERVDQIFEELDTVSRD